MARNKRKASRPRRKTTAMLKRKARGLWAKRRAMASAKRPVSAFIAARKAQLATFDQLHKRKAAKPKAKRRRKPMSAAARAAFRDRMMAARAEKRGGRLPRGNWTGYSGDEIRDMLANGDRPPRKARKPKRKSNRPPMSAAQREAFKRRMAEARARKAGNRGRRFNNAQSGPEVYAPREAPRGPEPTNREAYGPTRGNLRKGSPRRTYRSQGVNLPTEIAAILRNAGYSAKVVERADCFEIVTDAPEAVCAQAAAEAGA